MNALPAALAYAVRLGWAVFPSRDGRPLCAHGVHSASNDPEEVRRLWSRAGEANVSVACGKASGILALDVDCKGDRDGLSSLALLEAEYGELPPTWSWSTPNNGLVFVFKHTPTPNRFDFRPGLELHSDGTAVTLPPSQKNGRRYVWTRDPKTGPLADAPAWLLAAANPPAPPLRPRLSAPPSRDRLVNYVAAAVDGECRELATMPPRSGRNLRLFQAAARLGELVGAGLLPQDHAEACLEAAAQDCGLVREDGLRSVRATIASGMRRGLAKPREVAK